MRGRLLQQAFDNGLKALGQASDAERLRLALSGAGEAVFDWTIADDRIVWDGAEFALRNHPDPARMESGHAFRAWLSPDARGRLLSFIEETAPIDPAIAIEFEIVTADSREWFEMRVVRSLGVDGRADRVTGILRIVTEQKTMLTRLSYLASRDELTGHLNRTRLCEELSRLIAKSKADQRPCAYVVAAIDSLAVINETYGFDVADEVIVSTGQRLVQSLRAGDVIGRSAGNKFGVILSECGEREIALIAERLQASVRSTVIETSAGPVAATISIGAVWLPESASTSQEAMLRAEEALERAKSSGRNGFAVSAKSARRESSRRRLMTIADDVMSALDEHRLIFAYQPIISAKTRLPEHHECLLRMTRKDGTIAAAGEFVPAAETLGMVRLIDRRALEMAVARLYEYPDIKLSINVSGTAASDSAWLHSFITYVQEHRDIAERMMVELTETAALHAFEDNARFITRLRDMGCRVAIDDFGAGYTSFRNLHMVRFDMVKIDGAYVKNLSQSPDNQLFVRTLVELAKNFQLETVAEWVGSEEDAQLLTGFGVDYFQGYYFGEPLIAPDWINARPAIARRA